MFDPGVCSGEAFAELDGGFPVELFEDFGVVAVAAIDAFGCVEFVVALQFDAGYLFGDVYELVNGNEFVGAEVERLVDLALGDHPGARGCSRRYT